MATKSNEAWVNIVGEEIRDLLRVRQGRQFEFHQAGPYTQTKAHSIDIHFNENQSGAKYSRFGYVLSSFVYAPANSPSVPANPHGRLFSAGFSLFHNTDVILNRFLPNLHTNLNSVAENLGGWLQEHESAYFKFPRRGEKDFEWEPRMATKYLAGALAKYGDLERKSTGVTEQRGTTSGTHFTLVRAPSDYGPLSDDEIVAHSTELAGAAVEVFNELSFLYELLLSYGERIGPRHVPDPAPPPEERVSVVDPSTEDHRNAEEGPAPEPFEIDNDRDERSRVFAEVARRQGQGRFRDALLEAYNGKCAVTDYGVSGVLQAAHIKPYSGETSNHVTNGILLRADVHNLFDLHLLCIDPKTNKIEVAPSLLGTEYGRFHGLRLRLPNDKEKRPNAKALEQHYNLRSKK